jgi:hypothetical protein
MLLLHIILICDLDVLFFLSVLRIWVHKPSSLFTKGSWITVEQSAYFCRFSICSQLMFFVLSTVALAVWAMDNKAISPSLELVVDGIVQGGVGTISTNNPGYSSRG